MTRRALVVTVVHHPEDSRIRARQIAALLEAGWEVTYAAPFSGYDLAVPKGEPLTAIDLPRAAGRRRFAAGRAVRALLAREGPRHDVIVVHDPEVLLAAIGLGLDHLVWDVHEDPAAALQVKEWMPRPLRGIGARAWRGVERVAERRWPLLLAEQGYAERFRRSHRVVPNTATVPETSNPVGTDRVVYVGNVTVARGVETMVEVARQVRAATDGDIALHVIGPARDARSTELLNRAHAAGDLVWHGFLPSAEAMPLLDGALAGLSLLQDLPNYRPSMPTKVIEYLAHGVPAITTPLPLAVDLIERSGGGVVVPFDDPDAVTAAVLAWRDDPGAAAAIGALGHAYAREHFDWGRQGPEFVAALEEIAQRVS